ncbi:MAG: hypothetical protein IKW51_01665 [Bacteroidales bacterium]|nr:hypothetical protein [Bacteroidales bacterium]
MNKKINYPNGDCYEGEWKDDKRCGKGICWYGRNKDKMYEGDWLNDKREGHGIWKYENGDIVECEWKSGDKNGEGIFTFADFPSHLSGLLK